MFSRLSRFAVLLIAAACLQAQTDRAVLTGTIADTSGRAIPAATVTVESQSTGLRRTAITSEAGAYTLSALPVGFYSASINASGFQRLRVAPFELQVGQTRTLDLTLSVASVETTVEVVAEAPLAETNAAVTGVIAGGQIRNLPVNGRSWASLMSLVPGGVDTGGNDQRSIRFAGRGLDDNNFRFDGVDATGIQNQAQRVAQDCRFQPRPSPSFVSRAPSIPPKAEAQPAGRSKSYQRREVTTFMAAFSNSFAIATLTLVLSTPGPLRPRLSV